MAKKGAETSQAGSKELSITGYDGASGAINLTGANVPADEPGGQPAVLANLALANQIANQNLAQQNAIQFQQAMFQLQLAAVAKCAELILSINPADPDAASKLAMYKDLMDTFMEKFRAIPEMVGAGQG